MKQFLSLVLFGLITNASLAASYLGVDEYSNKECVLDLNGLNEERAFVELRSGEHFVRSTLKKKWTIIGKIYYEEKRVIEPSLGERDIINEERILKVNKEDKPQWMRIRRHYFKSDGFSSYRGPSKEIIECGRLEPL